MKLCEHNITKNQFHRRFNDLKYTRIFKLHGMRSTWGKKNILKNAVIQTHRRDLIETRREYRSQTLIVVVVVIIIHRTAESHKQKWEKDERDRVKKIFDQIAESWKFKEVICTALKP